MVSAAPATAVSAPLPTPSLAPLCMTLCRRQYWDVPGTVWSLLSAALTPTCPSVHGPSALGSFSPRQYLQKGSGHHANERQTSQCGAEAAQGQEWDGKRGRALGGQRGQARRSRPAAALGLAPSPRAPRAGWPPSQSGQCCWEACIFPKLPAWSAGSACPRATGTCLPAQTQTSAGCSR